MASRLLQLSRNVTVNPLFRGRWCKNVLFPARRINTDAKLNQYWKLQPLSVVRHLSTGPHPVQSPEIFFDAHTLAEGDFDVSVCGRNTLEKVELDIKEDQVAVSWEDGSHQVYPLVWFRENCHCPKCFHAEALEALKDRVNLNFEANSVEMTSDSLNLIIHWKDGHESVFPSDWLRIHRFEDSPDDRIMDRKFQSWKAEGDIGKFEFEEFLEDDLTLLKWLGEFTARGIVLLKNAPTKVGQVQRLCERIAFIRHSLYGPNFDVISVQKPSNIGYTTGPLTLHTDLAYYMKSPEVLSLHCIKQVKSKGGESMFADGFEVATDLKKTDPEAFSLLSTYPFEFYGMADEYYGRFFLHSRKPTIRLNERGNLVTITLSHHSRGPVLRAPVNQVLPIYHALDKLYKLIHKPKYGFHYKMEEGDIVTLNNHRVAHGRNAYETLEDRDRHVQGGYMDLDEVYSRLRVLEIKLDQKM